MALIEHTVVVARATAAAARISRGISQAQACGDLKFFNAKYKRRRTETLAVGKSFLSYGQPRARLQKAIASGAAAGGVVTSALVASVLGSLDETKSAGRLLKGESADPVHAREALPEA